MNITVMGAGAVGGYFGAVLARAGHDVTFIARGENLEAIQQNGYSVKSDAIGEFAALAKAVENPTEVADLILFCVKGYDNDIAVDIVAPAVGEETSILTLQNGIGSSDLLSTAFGHDKVLLGLTYIDSTKTGPGIVHEFGLKPPDIVFGEQNKGKTDRARVIGDALDVEGVELTLADNIQRELWSKLIYICGLSGSTCITRSKFEQVVTTPATLEFTRRIMREAFEVAQSQGAELNADYVDKTVEYFIEIKGANTSSMYTDLMRGNPIEIDVLNGAVARIGRQQGIDVTTNEFIATCLSLYHEAAMESR